MAFSAYATAREAEILPGDTLETIAEREQEQGNDVTAEDIARFNWGTDDPEHIQELLRDRLGATRRSAPHASGSAFDRYTLRVRMTASDPPALFHFHWTYEGKDGAKRSTQSAASTFLENGRVPGRIAAPDGTLLSALEHVPFTIDPTSRWQDRRTLLVSDPKPVKQGHHAVKVAVRRLFQHPLDPNTPDIAHWGSAVKFDLSGSPSDFTAGTAKLFVAA